MKLTLIHFTSKDGLCGILENGFALLPCDRALLDDLFGRNRPFEGDPQNFGMVCFSEALLEKSAPVRKKGNYGIAVKFDWAEENGIRKVQYISRLKAFRLQRRFRKAVETLKSRIGYPEDEGLKLAFKNKEFAAFMGAPEYTEILDEYEYFQTSRDKAQREWRITQKLPFYNLQPGQVPSGKRWGRLYFRKIEPQDIKFLVCPTGHEAATRNFIPNRYRCLEIKSVPS